MSVEDRVDGLRETSEVIASECDVTFELYCICTEKRLDIMDHLQPQPEA